MDPFTQVKSAIKYMVKPKTKSISNLGTFSSFLKLNVQSIISQNSRMKLKRQQFVLLWSVGAERVSKIPEYACVHRKNWFIQYKTCLTHPKSWMIGRSKELEDVGRVASSFLTYLGKIEATLLAG